VAEILPHEAIGATSVAVSVAGAFAASRAEPEPASKPALQPAGQLQRPASPTPRPKTAPDPFMPGVAVEPTAAARQGQRAPVDPFTEADLTNAGREPKRQRGRGPTLFERMTGTGRARREDGEELPPAEARPQGNQTNEAEPAKKPEREPLLDAVAARPSRTAFAASPSSASDEDPLEIPAFLRRQAN
jgi:cell division protein FtsZ